MDRKHTLRFTLAEEFKLASSVGATPGQKKICFDYSHNNRLILEDTPFVLLTDYLFNQNYGLAKAELGFKNEAYLQNFDAIVIGNMYGQDLTLEEIENLVQFVQAGGGLIVVSDQGGDYENHNNLSDLTDRFGIRFNPDYVKDPVEFSARPEYVLVESFRPHFITQNLTSFVHSNGCSLTVNLDVVNPNLQVDAIAFASDTAQHEILDQGEWMEEPCPGATILACAEYFAGRLVAIGNVSLFSSLGTNYGLKMEENQALVESIFSWLLGVGTPPREERNASNKDLPDIELDPVLRNWALEQVEQEKWKDLPDVINYALQQLRQQVEAGDVPQIRDLTISKESTNTALATTATLDSFRDTLNALGWEEINDPGEITGGGRSNEPEISTWPEKNVKSLQEIKVANDHIDALETKLNALTTEYEDQLAERLSLEFKTEDLQNQLQQATNECNLYLTIKTELEKQVENLAGQAEAKKILEEKASRLAMDVERQQSALEQCQSRIFQLEGDLVVAQVCQPVDDAENQIQLKDQQISELTEKLTNLQATVEIALEQLETEHTERAVLEEQNAQLESQLSNQVNLDQVAQLIQENRRKDKQIKELAGETEVLRSHIAHAQEEIRIRENTIQDLTREAEIQRADLQTQIDNLTQFSNTANDNEQGSQSQKIQDLQEACKRLEIENAECHRQTQELLQFPTITTDESESVLKELEEKIRQKEDLATGLLRENEALKQDIATHREEMDAIRNTLTDERAELAMFREKVQNTAPIDPRTPNTGDKQIQLMATELDRWRAKYEDSEVLQVKLLNDIQKLKDEKETLLAQLNNTAPDVTDGKKRVKFFKRNAEKAHG